jgi:hypothetical protein
MAKVDLLPRKEFTITLDSGEVIKGKYSLWAAKRFCDKKKLTLKQLVERLTEENMTLDDLVENILCAVEHCQRESGLPFKYNDLNVCSWIEEMGGIGSDQYNLLVGHAFSELEPEKKNQVMETVN